MSRGLLSAKPGVRDNAQTPNSLQWNATGTAYTTLSLILQHDRADRASHVTTTTWRASARPPSPRPSWTTSCTSRPAAGYSTRDAKKALLDVVNGALPSYVDANKNTVVGKVPLDESWSHFDPMVSVAYEATSDINLYGRWATGCCCRRGQFALADLPRLRPEKVIKMFEVGYAKTEFWSRRGRLNIAAFTGDIKDAQVDFNVVIVGNNRGTLETTNAATGKTKGLEADLTLMPVEGLTLSASYAYTDVKLSKASTSPSRTPSRRSIRCGYPKNAGSLAMDYVRPAFGATLKAHLDAVNFADAQYTSTTDPTKSDKPFTMNGRLTLADIQLPKARAPAPAAVGLVAEPDQQVLRLPAQHQRRPGHVLIFSEPRTFGVEANVKF
ncbi:TonB-dependent receptor domain-containing protein [Caulobacter segnis]